LALAELWSYWREGGGNPLLDIATGLGKSLVLAELARRFAQRGRRVLLLSHVREILEQDLKALLALWPQAPVGINCAALGERTTDAPIVLASVQSVFRNPEALGELHLIAVDEAHLVRRDEEGMYHSVLSALHGRTSRVVGATATVYRLDSGRLDEGEGRLFDRVVYRYGIAEGIRDDWLAPLVAKATHAEIDTRGVGKRGGEFIAGELEQAADRVELVAGAVKDILAHSQGRRAWLAFCCGVDHAFHVRDALRAQGVSAETLIGDTAADERKRIIEDFRAGKFTALTGVNCFTTGFDVAQIDLIAMLRPTCSPGLYVQMAGRGTRKADGKTNALLLDFGGNVARHGPVDLVTGERTQQRNGRGGGSGVAPTKVCPACDSIVPAGTATCPDCGHVWPPREFHHAVRAGEISPLGGAPTRLDVYRMRIGLHAKDGRPPSLRVDFLTASGRISDWLAFEHSAGARYYAERKWAALGGRNPMPASTDEALARGAELAASAITVRRDGGYWRVEGVEP
jgi:DNA repair protein RadD